jgi:hypothetical protein
MATILAELFFLSRYFYYLLFLFYKITKIIYLLLSSLFIDPKSLVSLVFPESIWQFNL